MPHINKKVLKFLLPSLIILLYFPVQSLFAKGLESIQAEESDQKAPTETRPEVGVDESADAAVNGADDQGAETSTTDLEKKQEEEAPASDNVTQPASVVDSTGPWDDKAFLATTFGWVGTSSSKGNFRSLGASDVTAGYLLPKQFIPSFKTWGIARALAVSVTADKDYDHFTGVVNVFSFGIKSSTLLGKKLSLIGEGGLSLYQSRLDPVNEGADAADLEMTGVGLNLATGLDYLLLEKMSVGPRFGAIVGNYKFIQFALSFEFLI